jgi:hypothetical protein
MLYFALKFEFRYAFFHSFLLNNNFGTIDNNKLRSRFLQEKVYFRELRKQAFNKKPRHSGLEPESPIIID